MNSEVRKDLRRSLSEGKGPSLNFFESIEEILTELGRENDFRMAMSSIRKGELNEVLAAKALLAILTEEVGARLGSLIEYP